MHIEFDITEWVNNHPQGSKEELIEAIKQAIPVVGGWTVEDAEYCREENWPDDARLDRDSSLEVMAMVEDQWDPTIGFNWDMMRRVYDEYRFELEHPAGVWTQPTFTEAIRFVPQLNESELEALQNYLNDSLLYNLVDLDRQLPRLEVFCLELLHQRLINQYPHHYVSTEGSTLNEQDSQLDLRLTIKPNPPTPSRGWMEEAMEDAEFD